MMTDLVSVIVPVYNSEKTIQRCVHSLINQTYRNLQILLVDDGSTDLSLSICESMKEADPRITILTKTNGGVSSARNCGIDNATGKYLMFLDSDDWFDEYMVEHYVNILDEQNADVVIGGINFIGLNKDDSVAKRLSTIGNQGVSLWNEICLSMDMFGYLHGKLFKKDIIDKFNTRFDESMYAQEDLDFCLSYYSGVNNFFLTEYAGYQYIYQPGKRRPPYCDFIRNQLKLFRLAREKCELKEESYRKVQERICGYIYMMFYEAGSLREVIDVSERIKAIDEIDAYLRICNLNGEIKCIIKWYLGGRYTMIYKYFKARRYIKKILLKG